MMATYPIGNIQVGSDTYHVSAELPDCTSEKGAGKLFERESEGLRRILEATRTTTGSLPDCLSFTNGFHYTLQKEGTVRKEDAAVETPPVTGHQQPPVIDSAPQYKPVLSVELSRIVRQ